MNRQPLPSELKSGMVVLLSRSDGRQIIDIVRWPYSKWEDYDGTEQISPIRLTYGYDLFWNETDLHYYCEIAYKGEDLRTWNNQKVEITILSKPAQEDALMQALSHAPPEIRKLKEKNYGRDT